jgi:predicted flap endonuclease-1-like 5' DNA nuclease
MARLDSLALQVQQRAAAAPPPKPLVRAGSRNLLARAAHGKPDDLKRIHGVAEVLEKMLHRIGVYYFWQIAEWDATDIQYVDNQLTAFKGRIRRDDWVAQSRRFLREGGVAVKPAES